MLKLKSVFLFVLLTVNSYSQNYIEQTTISKEGFAAFKESKLYVVLGILNETYDSLVTQSMHDDWIFTDFEFIDTLSFRKLSFSNDDYFFLVPHQFQTGRYDYETNMLWNKSDYIKLKIIKGSYQNFESIMGYGEIFPTAIASTLLRVKYDSYSEDEKKDMARYPSLRAAYQNKNVGDSILPVLIRNLHYQCMELIEPGKKRNPKKRLKVMNSARRKIHSAPVYVLESDLNTTVSSIESLQNHFSGESYVVAAEDYVDLIMEKKDVYIVVCAFNSLENYVRVIHAKSGEIIYIKRNAVSENYPAGLIKYHLNLWERSK